MIGAEPAGYGLPIYGQGRIGADELHLIVDGAGLTSRRLGRMAVRKAWDREAPFLAQTPYWHRRRQRRNRRVDLTDKDVDDASHVAPLLVQLAGAQLIHGRRRL